MTYTSRVSNGRGFRMVYPICDQWRWHTNVAVRDLPPKQWANRAGWTRWKWLGIVKSFGAYAWLRLSETA